MNYVVINSTDHSKQVMVSNMQINFENRQEALIVYYDKHLLVIKFE
jgi:hypothetical protein